MASKIKRETLVVQGNLALQDERYRAARNKAHGLQIMHIEHLAARLCGGFFSVVDVETLRDTVQRALPEASLDSLEKLRALPGMVQALVDTIGKVWHSGINLHTVTPNHPRLDVIARLEKTISEKIPSSKKNPGEIVKLALERLRHAQSVLGPVTIKGIEEMAPCWKPLLKELAEHVSVTWHMLEGPIPSWLQETKIKVIQSPLMKPVITRVCAATNFHEALEATRWARQLVVEGTAHPHEIGIAAVHTSDYDDHFMSLCDESAVSIHFVHGTKLLASKDGQTVAALADLLTRGLTQTRVRRLIGLLGRNSVFFSQMPAGWLAKLPPDAPMDSPAAWERFFVKLSREVGEGETQALRKAVNLLASGLPAAEEAGRAFLGTRSLAIWTKALRLGPPASLERSLEALKLEDGLHPQASVSWMPAGALASSGRRFVRLLGLNSSRWPRGKSEDSLLADHILSAALLDPHPISDTDRRDFAQILATTGSQVVLSRARRDSEGRLLGESALLGRFPEEAYLQRHRTPAYPHSNSDRLTSCPQEFQKLREGVATTAAWKDWKQTEITPHDGLVRSNHPAIVAALGQVQSAKSLSLLLRNPLGFVWRYVLGFREPNRSQGSLLVDGAMKGNWVHECCEKALGLLEQTVGLCSSSLPQREKAVQNAIREVEKVLEIDHGLPPKTVWEQAKQDVCALSIAALSFEANKPAKGRSWAEVPFGGGVRTSGLRPAPWDASLKVKIPGTQLLISGHIDRLSLSPDSREALVVDYKTGRMPKEPIILDGGRELQRCLYAFATQAMLGPEVTVRSALAFAQESDGLLLEQPQQTLSGLSYHLQRASESLLARGGPIGIDAASDYDDNLFLLPANASAVYCKRKAPAAKAMLGQASEIWDHQ